MGAISSLSTAFSALRRNPVILAATFIAALLGSLSYVGQAFGPLGSLAVSAVSFLISIFVTPFITAGLVGMSEEAVVDRTNLGTFVREGKANYLSMLGAYLLFIGGIILIGIVFAIVVVILAVAGGFALGAGGAGGGAAGLGLGLVAVLLVFLLLAAILVAVFLLQFYDVAIVVSGEGAVGSLRRSISFVRQNVLGVLGYSVIYVVVSVLAALPAFWLSFSATDFPTAADPAMTPTTMAQPMTIEMLPVILATIVISTVVSAFLWPYKVAFYVGQSEPSA